MSSTLTYFLTVLNHRLPLRLTEPTVTQYSPFFTITTVYHLKTFTTSPSPLLAVSHPSTGTVPITVLQTHKRKYTHIAQPKKTIHHHHHHYHNTPHVLHVTVTSYKPLPLHNAYRKTYIICYIQYISCTNIN